jgi:DNA processing protein
MTPEGALRAKKLAKLLVENDVTVISGLAKGIDTVALTAAIENGGRVIAVIGTPIDRRERSCSPSEESFSCFL